MNASIAAFVCAPLLVTGLAAQSAARENDPSRIGSRRPVDVSLEGLREASPRTSDRLIASPAPLACLKSIVDQATGGCLTASSTATLGVLFPYPGLGNQFVPQAFVGGGEDNQATGLWSTVAGGLNNRASDSFATVAGGWSNRAGHYGAVSGGRYNTASADYATVGGGVLNAASAYYATVAGGRGNTASGIGATVGGGGYPYVGGPYARSGSAVLGSGNTASGDWSTVGGGRGNIASGSHATVCGGGGAVGGSVDGPGVASGDYSAVGGGYANTASGHFATVPGGGSNTALGVSSFAAGSRAKANHDGAFVWGDTGLLYKESSAADEFSVYCSGGARFFTNSAATTGVLLAPGGGSWSSVSDRDSKENVEPVDGRDVLERLASLPLATWNYRAQDDSVRHLGPMAQDFYEAFGLGVSDRMIDTIDADGVALAAIQGLNAELEERLADKDAQIEELRSANEALVTRVERLEGVVRAATSGPVTLAREVEGR